jgi:hypothetical protein
MLRCKDVTELIGSECAASAGLRTRLAVRMHLLWCRHCRAYARSLRKFAAIARRLALGAPIMEGARLEEIVGVVRREAERVGPRVPRSD